MKLMSLFDGSGSFPLSAKLCGIEPVYASEVEPFPIAVTRARFPDMTHLGDVSKINGAELEPVDIVTFGSPCQDLSVAGKRAGLQDGARSSLFFQAIRIIKEMRESTNGRYPRFAVWENVHGAFSSNKGDDFRAVLEQFCMLGAGCDVPIPRPAKWWGAGCIMGDTYSVAWRTVDAQYWGVPQRRKRIYLVADLDAQRAGEILFKSESLPGYSAEGFKSWQGAARSTESCTGETGGFVLNDQGVVYGIDRAAFNQGKNAKYDISIEEELNSSLVAKGPSAVAYGIGNGQANQMDIHDKIGALNCMHDQQAVMCDYIVRRLTPIECARLQGFPDWWCDDIAVPEPTEDDMRFWRGVFDTYCDINGQKRKTDNQIRKWLADPHTDSAEYKMWGNGCALPNAYYVIFGISEILKSSGR